VAKKKLVVIGFDSISLNVLQEFVRRGALPTVGKLMEQGCVTQTWPCFPMETGTNWPSLATGASPWVTGCNMHLHLPGDPLDKQINGFPSELCKAEQLWTTVQKAGKKAVVFDWAGSWPLKMTEGLIHAGEDGRPDNALHALQEVRGYTTHPRQPGPHVTEVHPAPCDWPGAPDGALMFELTVVPGPLSLYKQVSSLWALVLKGDGGYDRVAVYDAPGGQELFCVGLNEWSDWLLQPFTVDGETKIGGLRGKLLVLSPDASQVHLYLSEIYDQSAFVQPAELAAELAEACGPFIIQCSRQQVVQGGASDIATYFEEQATLAHWWKDAAAHLLSKYDWDLFMLKWHGPDWTNHLTMYMIDERHPMYEPERAAEGWAMWDELMGWGDEIVKTIMDVAGPDTVVALVSDHGGGTQLPGIDLRIDINGVLERHGWLVRGAGGKIDWTQTKAWGAQHYVWINLQGRDPDGIVAPGAEYLELQEAIIEAMLDDIDANGRHTFRTVVPRDEAGRLGVGGDRVGDVFMVPAKPHPLATVDKEAFWAANTRVETGTWDWPRLNTGNHLDDSYFVIAGPGIRQGYLRPRPTLITSVAPTLATALGVPVPADADGTVLHEFFE
jgi:predicted AlkP superfamily phosphohydrolase/phosphomutase